ncbi:MAG: cupredoxin domain-containing protein [Nitrosotalea sp.]
MDENSSTYIYKNIQMFTQNVSSVNKYNDDFHESNLMHSVNEYVFGNLPGLTIKINMMFVGTSLMLEPKSTCISPLAW